MPSHFAQPTIIRPAARKAVRVLGTSCAHAAGQAGSDRVGGSGLDVAGSCGREGMRDGQDHAGGLGAGAR